MECAPWEGAKVFSLTYVFYPKGDLVGKFLGFAGLIPFCLFVVAFTLFVTRREFVSLYCMMGLILSDLLNKVIKNTIQQARPLDSPKDDFGMPSAHTQFVFFTATFVLLLLFRWKRNRLEDILWGGSLWVSAVIVAISRVYFRYHTPIQVIVGALLGIVLGYIMYQVYSLSSKSFIPWLQELSICKFFRLVDSEPLRKHAALSEYHYALSRQLQQKSLPPNFKQLLQNVNK
jgi:dolichyldiphosphatase